MSRLSTGLFVLSAFVVGSLLDGCSTPSLFTKSDKDSTSEKIVTPARPVQVPLKFIAVGHGALGSASNAGQMSPQQQKLMAMRAARVDAYRNLAEQVNGFRISGNTTVASLSAQNDVVRSSVDAFIRGARLISTQPVADGIYEVTIEMEMSVALMELLGIQCPCDAYSTPVSAVPRLEGPSRVTQNGCVGLGCSSAQ